MDNFIRIDNFNKRGESVVYVAIDHVVAVRLFESGRGDYTIHVVTTQMEPRDKKSTFVENVHYVLQCEDEQDRNTRLKDIMTQLGETEYD